MYTQFTKRYIDTLYYYVFHLRSATRATWSEGNTTLGIALCCCSSSSEGKGTTWKNELCKYTNITNFTITKVLKCYQAQNSYNGLSTL